MDAFFHDLDNERDEPKCFWCFGPFPLVTAKRVERDGRSYRREYRRCKGCEFTSSSLARYWPGTWPH
jgi:hypothetical protein